MFKYLPYILVMALVTYLIRMLPLVFCQQEIKSVFVKSFLFYVPYAVLGEMTFTAIFKAVGTEPKQVAAATLGCLIAIYLAYCKKSLLTVAIAACVMVYLANLFL